MLSPSSHRISSVLSGKGRKQNVIEHSRNQCPGWSTLQGPRREGVWGGGGGIAAPPAVLTAPCSSPSLSFPLLRLLGAAPEIASLQP